MRPLHPPSGLLGTLLLALAPAALGAQVPSWQQGVEYRIEATLDEDAGHLEGRALLRYTNASPDTLLRLFLHQSLNAFRPGSVWAATGWQEDGTEFGDLTEPDHAYQRLSRLRVDGRDVEPAYPRAPDSTVVEVPLAGPLPPNGELTVEMAWTARPSTLCRRQCRRGRHWDFAHWYPRIAVYDHGGWQARALHPQGEFYGEFASYDVTLELAGDQVIGATGVPVEGDPGWEPSEWSPRRQPLIDRNWYGRAPPAASLGLLADEPPGDRRRIRFLARDVHHFAFSVNPEYRYEGGQSGGTAIHVLYRPGDLDWDLGVAVARTIRALEWLEGIFGPYPYPQLTNLHRLEGGATEFPMVIMDGSPGQSLILHETAHQFAHGILGNNEWREAWLDEGMASFLSGWFSEEVGGVDHPWAPLILRLGRDSAVWRFPMDTLAHELPDFSTYQTLAYTKGQVVLFMLRELVGKETMRRILAEYYERNRFRHVTSHELQAAAEDLSGRELGWFFDQWVREPAELDYAVEDVAVAPTGDGRFRTTVRVRRRGGAWMPVTLQVGSARRTLESRERVQTVTVVTDERPEVVVLDPDLVLLETEKGNNGRRIF